jgi:hypothetical protein
VSDISYPAQYAYEHGTDPITYAESHVTMLIGVHLGVAAAREENPQSFPIYSPDVSNEALARRIVGGLLDAGWTPPEPANGQRLNEPEKP